MSGTGLGGDILDRNAQRLAITVTFSAMNRMSMGLDKTVFSIKLYRKGTCIMPMEGSVAKCIVSGV